MTASPRISQLVPLLLLPFLLALGGCQPAEPPANIGASQNPAPPPEGTNTGPLAESADRTQVTIDLADIAPQQGDRLARAWDLEQLPELLEVVTSRWPTEMGSEPITLEDTKLTIQGPAGMVEEATRLIEALRLAEAQRASGTPTNEITVFEIESSLPAEEQSQDLILRLYSIEGLLGEETPLFNRRKMTAIISSTCAPTMWDEVGGLGSLRRWRGLLAVSQYEDNQERIAQTLDLLRQAEALEDAWQIRSGPLPDPEPLFLRTIAPEDEPIFAALDKKSSFHFQDASLTELANTLSRAYDIEVVVDEEELEYGGLSGEIALTSELDDITLRSFLRIALKRFDLTILVRGGKLWITVPQDVEPNPETILYPSYDLVDEEIGLKQLSDLFRDTVDPECWDEVGGIGSIDTWAGSLVISQTQTTQQNCEDLWRLLREGRKLMQAWDGIAPPPTSLGLADSPWRDDFALRQNLRQQVDLPEQTLELEELATRLREEFGCQTIFNPWDVENGRLDPQATVQCGGQGTLVDVLQEDLQPLGLVLEVKDEVLWIVPANAYGPLVTRLYPVFDLTALPAEEGQPREFDMIAASEIGMDIEDNIAPDEWYFAGGSGVIEFYGGGLLVIRQTEELHRKVERHLERLRNNAVPPWPDKETH